MAKTIFIAVIGLGGVGKAFLSQLDFLRQRLATQNPPIDLRLILARRSTKQLFSQDFSHLNIHTVTGDVDSKGTPPPPFNETFGQLARAPGRVVLVDNTSDVGLASLYPMVLQRGISIVTPNKKAFSDKFELWESIFKSAANGTGSPSNGYVFHESTVGAGLPVLSSLKELVETGDEVTKIEVRGFYNKQILLLMLIRDRACSRAPCRSCSTPSSLLAEEGASSPLK